MRVLVVEDERITRRSTRRHLERWGYHTVAVENGAQAWEEFQRERFEIVVTDWDMPEVDGHELTKRIRASESAGYSYVILLTGRTGKSDLVEGLEAGADDFLSKPFDRDELRARLRVGERIIRLEKELAVQNRKLANANDRLSGNLNEIERVLQELKESQTALVQAKKMVSLGKLVAGVAHEINSPLGALRSGIGTIDLAVVKLDARVRESGGKVDKKTTMLLTSLTALARQAQQACERIDGIVTNLRQFAQLDRADCQRVNIHAGLESTLHLLRHEFGEGIELHTEFGEIPEIDCAPRELNQLFMNVILNAKEAIEMTERGGAIRLRTWTDGDCVKVEFADNGCGIPTENLDQVFDPGFTTKGVQVGTGLGLAICYQIAKTHGGSLDVSSVAGDGTQVTLSLPVRARS